MLPPFSTAFGVAAQSEQCVYQGQVGQTPFRVKLRGLTKFLCRLFHPAPGL